MSRIYLAGPMRQIPYHNFPAFHYATDKLRAEGHVVFSPAENDLHRFGYDGMTNPTGDDTKLPPGMTIRTCMADYTVFICNVAEAIAMLPGWEKSSGASTEHKLAICIGLEVLYLTGTPYILPRDQFDAYVSYLRALRGNQAA